MAIGFIEDTGEIARMRDDVCIANDCLNSIMTELYNDVVSRTYIVEKARTVKNCIEFILAMASEV